MADIVGEVQLKVTPVDPGGQFERGVQGIIKRIEKNAVFNVGADTRVAEENISRITSQAQSAGAAFAQATVQAAAFTATVFGIRAAVEGAIGKLGGLFDGLAQAQAGFNSILKSESAGKGLLDDIREFARVSPFVTQELVNYSQQLLGVGVSAQKIVPLLENVGDLVSSVGGDTQNIGRVLYALSQVQSLGRLQGQDAMQLQSALIPITKILADYMGKTTAEVKKLQEQGAITAETVFNALNESGEKVRGAMNNATRNIAGARAVLSDTITIMFQEQPVLQKIFDDTWKSILGFANRLGEPAVQDSIERFFTNLGDVYESLKPLISAFAEIASSGALRAVEQLGTAFGAFGDALSIVPDWLWEVVGRLIAGLAALKAPLMLIQYVSNIRTMASSLIPAVAGLTAFGNAATQSTIKINSETAALQANTAALTVNQRAAINASLARYTGQVQGAAGAGGLSGRAGKAATAGSLGAVVGGGILSQQSGAGAQAAGGALTYGGIGAQIGMAGGPWGMAAGAAIGAAYGGLTAWMNASERKAQEHIQAMQDLGNEAAVKFIEAEGRAYENGTKTLGQSYTAAQQRLRELQAQRKTLTDTVPTGEVTNRATAASRMRATDAIKDDVTFIDAEIAKLTEDNTGRFELMQMKLREVIPLLNPQSAGYQALTTVGRGGGGTSFIPIDDIEKAEAVLKTYGITMEQVATMTNDDIVWMIENFDGLTSAQQQATRTATEFNTAWTEALGVAAGVIDPVVAANSKRISVMQTELTMQQTLTQATAFGATAVQKIEAENAVLAAIKLARTEAYVAATLRGADVADRQAAAELAAASVRAQAQDITTAAYLTNQQIREMRSEEEMQKWLELTGIVDTLENRELILRVRADGLAETNLALQEVQTRLEEMTASGLIQMGQNSFEARLAGAGRGAYGDTVPDAQGRTGTDKDINTIQQDPAIIEQNRQALIKLGAEMKRQEEEAARLAEEALRKAEAWAEAIKNSTESLTSTIESAVESIRSAAEAWTASIKERTQYESAVSASRLARNANRQVQDLQELSAGMANLRSRGITDDVLKRLGIDNVADVKQIRKLVNSSDADLNTLSASVSALTSESTALATAEEDKRTRNNIAEGIKQAAETLGFDMTRQEAATISNQFTITTGTNVEDVVLAFMNILTAGKIG